MKTKNEYEKFVAIVKCEVASGKSIEPPYTAFQKAFTEYGYEWSGEGIEQYESDVAKIITAFPELKDLEWQILNTSEKEGRGPLWRKVLNITLESLLLWTIPTFLRSVSSIILAAEYFPFHVAVSACYRPIFSRLALVLVGVCLSRIQSASRARRVLADKKYWDSRSFPADVCYSCFDLNMYIGFLPSLVVVIDMLCLLLGLIAAAWSLEACLLDQDLIQLRRIYEINIWAVLATLVVRWLGEIIWDGVGYSPSSWMYFVLAISGPSMDHVSIIVVGVLSHYSMWNFCTFHVVAFVGLQVVPMTRCALRQFSSRTKMRRHFPPNGNILQTRSISELNRCISQGTPCLFKSFTTKEETRGIFNQYRQTGAKIDQEGNAATSTTSALLNLVREKGIDLPAKTNPFSRMWGGLSGDVTSVHYDGGCPSILSLSVIGTKKWQIGVPEMKTNLRWFRPASNGTISFYRDPIKLEQIQSKYTEAIQESGDLLYLPPYYYHSVEYLSFAMTNDFCFNQPHLQEKIPFLHRCRLGEERTVYIVPFLVLENILKFWQSNVVAPGLDSAIRGNGRITGAIFCTMDEFSGKSSPVHL